MARKPKNRDAVNQTETQTEGVSAEEQAQLHDDPAPEPRLVQRAPRLESVTGEAMKAETKLRRMIRSRDKAIMGVTAAWDHRVSSHVLGLPSGVLAILRAGGVVGPEYNSAPAEFAPEASPPEEIDSPF